MRRAAKVDTSQQSIVDGLRAHGYRVEIIGKPVDLAIYVQPFGSTTATWMFMEVKTPTKSGKRRPRADQEAQERFIRETGTPVVMNLQEALKALESL